MSKSRATVLLIFQCPGICTTPSQVDILVSDDSPAFSPTMYNRVFTWIETRAISELRVGLLPLNMLKLSSISFTDSNKVVQLLLIVTLIYILLVFLMLSSDINVKNLALTPDCGAGVCVGDQEVITIQTSTMLLATVSRVDHCWRVGQWLPMHFTLTTRVVHVAYMHALNNNGNDIK